ncbi:MAG: hypothetical protein ACKOQ4_03560 [Mycobacterium sp.]
MAFWILTGTAVVLMTVVLWAGRKLGDARRRARADVIREQLRREDAELRWLRSLTAEAEA